MVTVRSMVAWLLGHQMERLHDIYCERCLSTGEHCDWLMKQKLMRRTAQ